MAQTVKNLPAMQETWVQSLGQKGPLEKGMATHSSILAWKTPWTEEPGRLQSMWSQKVRQNEQPIFSLSSWPMSRTQLSTRIQSLSLLILTFDHVCSWLLQTPNLKEITYAWDLGDRVNFLLISSILLKDKPILDSLGGLSHVVWSDNVPY